MMKLNENERLMCYALLMCGDTFGPEEFFEIRHSLPDTPKVNLVAKGAAESVGYETYALTPEAKKYLEQDSINS